jgi:RNA polymerase sigma-70 factor (ECF subfamily)
MSVGVVAAPGVSGGGGRSSDARMAALYRAHANALYRFLLRLTFGDCQAAGELVQQTLLRARRHLDVLAPDADRLRPWLFTVARHVAMDAARAGRARSAEARVVDPAWVAQCDDAAERVRTVRTIREALAQLSSRHRAVLIEVYCRGRSVTETAEALRIPEDTVKSCVCHALRSMRKTIAGAGRASGASR